MNKQANERSLHVLVFRGSAEVTVRLPGIVREDERVGRKCKIGVIVYGEFSSFCSLWYS